MLNIYNKYGRSVIAVFEVPQEEVSKYGVVEAVHLDGPVYSIKDLVEKPSPDKAPSNLAIVGRYIFTPRIFEKLRITKPGKGGEIQLTDAIKLLLEDEQVYAYKVENKVYDTGTPIGYIKTIVDIALQREDIKDEMFEFLQDIINKHSQCIDI